MTDDRRSTVCIGAGPAGLTAAYLLSTSGVPVVVIERDPTYVGGTSRTASYKGFHFDIGGHRFFSKSSEINALWEEILGDDFLERRRKSRILYRGRLFDYPLRAFNVLMNLGPVESLRCVISYAYAQVNPITPAHNFEEWVVNHFGWRLYNIFFKTYTEKVWGMKCTEVSADWAAQRIKGLSLSAAIWNAVRPQAKNKHDKVIKTLIDKFRYPRRGPGMMWEAAADKIRAKGGEVMMGLEVVEYIYDAGADRWTVRAIDENRRVHEFSANHVICSAAIRDVLCGLRPEPPADLRAAGEALRYRDFIMVALIVRDRGLFDDNWIYIHDPGTQVGRIQNFKSWSPAMVPDPSVTCYGLEYFCFEGDGLWLMCDAELIALAGNELVGLGLAAREDILDGHVVRQRQAYPVYDEGYQEHIGVVRAHIGVNSYPNLHLVGRNGMHKYNNQDHAMMTAILTVRNILAGEQLYDVWKVNQDAEYHEADERAKDQSLWVTQRMVPRRK